MPETAWRAALIEAKKEFGELRKTKVNPHFGSKFVPLNEIIGAVTEPLATHGFFLSQPLSVREGFPGVETRLYHVDDPEPLIVSFYPLTMSENPQKIGSQVTYARRYSISALFCLDADEDDDANTATNGHEQADTRPASQGGTQGQYVCPRCSNYNTTVRDTSPKSKRPNTPAVWCKEPECAAQYRGFCYYLADAHEHNPPKTAPEGVAPDGTVDQPF